MITTYKTLDKLTPLTDKQLLSAVTMKFNGLKVNADGYDSEASYSALNYTYSGIDQLTRDGVFKFQAVEGAKYHIFIDVTSEYASNSSFLNFLDYFSLNLSDKAGKPISVNENSVDEPRNSYIVDDFTAPYTGIYYINAGWHDGLFLPSFASVTIDENINTSRQFLSNSAPTGDLVINGKNSQGEVLSLKNTIADKDGLGDFEYEWFRGDAEITDATAETYTISGDDVGKKISVKVSYLVGDGYLETAFSSLSSTTAAKGASIGNDLLIGTNGNDKINGLAGNDTLVGGLGVDNLTGGLDADVFKFNASNETGITAKTRDVITDFKHSEGDKIDLSGIDAKSTILGDQAFVFIASKFFSGVAGEVRFDSKTAILYGNVNSDKTPDFAIAMTGVKNLVIDDFIL